MAIYKSSFNKKPEKKDKKEKPSSIEKSTKLKVAKKVNLNLVWLIVFLGIFFVSVLPSNILKNFFLGMFGLAIYPVCLVGIFFSSLGLTKKRIKLDIKYVVYLSIALFIIWFIFHLIMTNAYKIPTDNYGVYLSKTFLAKTTAGGLIFSLISFPIVKILTMVGAYIFSVIALAIFVGLIIDYINVQRNLETKEKKSKFDFKNIENFELDKPTVKVDKEKQQKEIAKRRLGLEKGETTIISSSMPTMDFTAKTPEIRTMSKRDYILTPLDPVLPTDNSDDIFYDNSTGAYNSKKVNKVQISNLEEKPNVEEIKPYTPNESTNNDFYNSTNTQYNHYNTDNQADAQYSHTESEYDDTEYKDIDNQETDDIFEQDTQNYNQTYDEDDIIVKDETDSNDYSKVDVKLFDKTEDDDLFEEPFSDFEDLNEDSEEVAQLKTEEITPDLNSGNFVDNYKNENVENENSYENYNDSQYETAVKNEYSSNYPQQDDDLFASTVETEVVRPSLDLTKFKLPNQIKKPINQVEQIKLDDMKPKEEIPPYVAPPADLLNYMDNPTRISDEELQDNIDRLEQVLEDFKVPAKVNNVQVGPAVTRYELTMPRGISVNKIAQMSDDIAMTLASNGAIRVEAPIPGKNSVGVEVPNKNVSPVSLRELIESNDYKVRGNPLSFVLGKDINGDIIFCNLDKMPHMLVAGSTGSGKSVCLNTMLLSMCYKAGPQDLRLILVDPKMVEFSTYSGLPHLLIPEVITGKEMTINALDWAIKEMERRYALFAKNHVVNINDFNKSDVVRTKREEKLPFIVIVVDELADLMLEAKREIEDRIAKLAAKARAAGIHLVLATQRPSVDVITGTVKANLPSRIAFALTNYMDSKTVLDGGGAEKLLGKGDMLFKPQDKPEARRVQGAFVSNAEISKVVEFIKQNNKPVYDDGTAKAIKNPHQDRSSTESGGKEQDFDPVLKEALKMFIQTKQASGSMISRRFSVGFNRAGRIMDQMELAGFIGPQEGSKPRQVYITMEEYIAIFGDDED